MLTCPALRLLALLGLCCTARMVSCVLDGTPESHSSYDGRWKTFTSKAWAISTYHCIGAYLASAFYIASFSFIIFYFDLLGPGAFVFLFSVKSLPTISSGHILSALYLASFSFIIFISIFGAQGHSFPLYFTYHFPSGHI